MQLDSKFKAILEYLADPGSHHHTGDKLICYLNFTPSQCLEVKRKLPGWLSLTKGFGYSFNTLSMAAVINEYFIKNPRRKKWPIPEVEDGMESISTFFKSELGS